MDSGQGVRYLADACRAPCVIVGGDAVLHEVRYPAWTALTPVVGRYDAPGLRWFEVERIAAAELKRTRRRVRNLGLVDGPTAHQAAVARAWGVDL